MPKRSSIVLFLVLGGLLSLPPATATVVEEIKLPDGSRPLAVKVDDDGRVWFTLDGPWALGRHDPESAETEFIALAEPRGNESDSLWSVRLGDDGSAWTASQTHAHRVDRSTLEAESFSLDARTLLSGDVHVDDAGRAWVTLVTADLIVRVDPATGEAASFPAGGERFGPLEFVDTGDAGVYFTATYADTFARLDTATGDVTRGPEGVAAAPTGIAWDGGALWIGEHGGSRLVRVDPASGETSAFPTTPSPYYPISGPSGVLVAKDGAVWFAEHFADRIARLDPVARTLHEFEVPSAPGVNVQRVAEAPDGRIWFAEWSKDRLGFVAFDEPPIGFDVEERVTVHAGESVTVDADVPGRLVVGTGVDGLEGTVVEGRVVLKAADDLPAGEYDVAIGSMDGKRTVSRYVTVAVEADADGTNETPAPVALVVAAMAAGAALAMRRRSA